MKLCIIHCYHLVHMNFAWRLLWRSTTEGLFTWRWRTPGRWGNPLRWGNPPVHIISHFNLITFTSVYMIGGLTRQMLPHLPVVPHLHVNRLWEQKYCQSFGNKPNHSHPVLRGRAKRSEITISSRALFARMWVYTRLYCIGFVGHLFYKCDCKL